jgi:hypothetical protein
MTPKPKEEAKPREPRTGSKSPPEESAEFQAFEKLAKQVVSIPKEEIDRRDAKTPKRRRSS